MKADLLKRVFRAINSGSEKDIALLFARIIEDEQRKGHTSLAKQLQTILDQKPNGHNGKDFSRLAGERELDKLPTSRRHNDPLVSTLSRELLRHHMVLADEIEARFHRIEKEYAARERLALYGLHHKKKILLYGPPGCGKTLGAERLAWNTGLPLIKVRFDAMISSYFGESAANLRRIFDSVKDSPSLLLLDECDFIAKSRNSTNDVGEVPRIVNTLLQLLEDYDAPGLLVAATNLDKMLDKALFRRFDDVFELPIPGSMQIEELLKMTLSSLQVDKNINWDQLAQKLAGASSANVVKAARDAAKSAVLAGKKSVQHDELEFAIAEIYRKDQQGDFLDAAERHGVPSSSPAVKS